MYVRRFLQSAALLAVLLAGPALAAAQPATALGQSLPNTIDVSSDTNWRPLDLPNKCKDDPIGCNKG